MANSKASEFSSFFRFAFGLVFLLAYWFASDVPSVSAQNKFNADDPRVEAIVDKAIAFLEKNTPESDLGQLTLAALAIVEAKKRYLQEIPKDNPVVKVAVQRIIGMPEIKDYNEVYIPAIATILLAEVDKTLYRKEVSTLVESIQNRVLDHGGINYMNQDKNTGDTSQIQYAALALYVANVHGFEVKPEIVKKMLNWLIESQQATGLFHYKLQQNGDRWFPNSESTNSRPSIHAGGLGTVYLIADMLQLFPRRKSMTKVATNEEFQDLPKTVIVFVPLVDGKENKFRSEGPVVPFDISSLNSSVNAGNRALEPIFAANVAEWNYYYLYALERYAWYREQAEGNLTGGRIPRWYDEGVEFLIEQQAADGSFMKPDFGSESPPVCTAFAILFLVRSSEVISLPNAESDAFGGMGFPDGIIQAKGTTLVGGSAEKDINAMLKMLEEEPSEEQLAALTQSMKEAISEFNQVPDKSRGDTQSFLRTMISSDNPYRRKIAIRLLAAEQDMDNVPALIYAMGDPEFDVCLEAHDGLRLISRRIDTMNLSAETRRKAADPYSVKSEDVAKMRAEFDKLKKGWTTWFLKIRPNAEFFD
jgi:hypothetical protein